MTTISPMLACGPCLGPEILVICIPWMVGIGASVANLVAIGWGLRKSPRNFGNLVFFLGYVGVGTAFVFEGLYGRLNGDLAMPLFFAIPALPIGHSVWLYISWLRKRKKLKQEPPAT